MFSMAGASAAVTARKRCSLCPRPPRRYIHDAVAAGSAPACEARPARSVSASICRASFRRRQLRLRSRARLALGAEDGRFGQGSLDASDRPASLHFAISARHSRSRRMAARPCRSVALAPPAGREVGKHMLSLARLHVAAIERRHYLKARARSRATPSIISRRCRSPAVARFN